MTEEQRMTFKNAEKERIWKSCSVQTHQSKKKDSMTPEDLKDYKKEAFRIKNLRNRKISTEHFNKEKT